MLGSVSVYYVRLRDIEYARANRARLYTALQKHIFHQLSNKIVKL